MTTETERYLMRKALLDRLFITLIPFGAVVVFLIAMLNGMLISPQSGSEASELADDSSVGVWLASNAMVYVALFNFVVAAVAVWLIARTLVETQQMLEQARLATKAANTANDHTRQMLINSERASVEENKPYLRATSFRLDDIVETNYGVKADFGFTIQNTGKTAAKNLHAFEIESLEILSPTNRPDTFASILEKELRQTVPISVLNPGDSIDVGGMITFAAVPSFGLEVKPLYMIMISFRFEDISTMTYAGVKTLRGCVFQMQRQPVAASDGLRTIDNVRTREICYVRSDGLIGSSSS